MEKDKFKLRFKRFIDGLRRLISPGYSCYICGRELEHPEYPICEVCQKMMEPITGKVCSTCGEPIVEPNNFCDECYGNSHEYDVARSCFVYDDYSRKIVTDLKYERRKYVVPFMAREMLLKLKDFGAMPDIVVPVPITPKRYKERRFNQSELIANELNTLTGDKLIVRTDLVTRVVDKIPQAKLNLEQRKKNLKGVFKLGTKEKLTGETVLILDDVYTTGSTVSEIAKTLRKLNPKEIWVLTFAKTNYQSKISSKMTNKQ